MNSKNNFTWAISFCFLFASNGLLAGDKDQLDALDRLLLQSNTDLVCDATSITSGATALGFELKWRHDDNKFVQQHLATVSEDLKADAVKAAKDLEQLKAAQLIHQKNLPQTVKYYFELESENAAYRLEQQVLHERFTQIPKIKAQYANAMTPELEKKFAQEEAQILAQTKALNAKIITNNRLMKRIKDVPSYTPLVNEGIALNEASKKANEAAMKLHLIENATTLSELKKRKDEVSKLLARAEKREVAQVSKKFLNSQIALAEDALEANERNPSRGSKFLRRCTLPLVAVIPISQIVKLAFGENEKIKERDLQVSPNKASKKLSEDTENQKPGAIKSAPSSLAK